MNNFIPRRKLARHIRN